MPMGSKHVISGVIERGDPKKRQFCYLLYPDDGGWWELEGGFAMRSRFGRLIGRQVTVHGTRIAFNTLHVKRLECAA